MQKVRNLLKELDKVISGYKDVKQKTVIALLADGHVLLESVPGLAKTTLIATLQASIGNSRRTRIQMTPDLKPTDIIGTRIFNQKTGEFEIAKGPIIGVNLALVDEINRGTPKTQSALLEAMQERRVSLAGQVFTLEDPFLVLATMNPIEQEGTYSLPEAQLDRFAFKLILDYVSREDEINILQNTTVHGRDAQSLVTPAITTEEIIALREHIKANIAVSRAAQEYIVDIVRATRPKDPLHKKLVGTELAGKIAVGASPRAQIWIQRTAQVVAYLDGKEAVTPEHIKYIARDVLRHRVFLTQEAALDGDFTTDHAIQLILNKVPVIEPKSK
jgi:MoxR-like ATPase